MSKLNMRIEHYDDYLALESDMFLTVIMFIRTNAHREKWATKNQLKWYKQRRELVRKNMTSLN